MQISPVRISSFLQQFKGWPEKILLTFNVIIYLYTLPKPDNQKLQSLVHFMQNIDNQKFM